jgi:hypothetical protein
MKHEIEVTLDLAKQYLKPTYDTTQPIEPQKAKEEGVFSQVIAELAKKDQDVLKIWNVVKKVKRK